jgi:hypothetical protein
MSLEIEVTKFVKQEDPNEYSNSVANMGKDAARITWQNAQDCDHSFVTEENKQEFVDYFKEFGAWTEEEMQEWPINELNALFIQEMSAQIKSEDTCSMFQTDDGKWYFYVGM